MKTSGKSWARYIDKSIKAKKVGYRKSSVTGERYYEARPDHSDSNPKERYADGGKISKAEKEKLSNLAYQLQNADDGWIKNNHGKFVEMQNEYKKQFKKVYGHSNYTDPNNYAKGGSLKSIAKKYEENEDINYHGENVILLAKHFGTAEDLKEAKRILALHNREGHLSSENGKKRYELNTKLIAKARKEMEAEGIKFAKGGAIYKGDKVRIKDSNKSMVVREIAKGKKGYVEFSGDKGTYLKGDLDKMAKGGITEHGLEIGDKITGRGHGDKIEGYNKENREVFTIDLDKGKRSSIRYAKGGSVISQFKVTSGRGGGKETWIISHPKIEDKGVYFKSDYTESEAKNDWYKNVFQKYEKGFYAKGGMMAKGGMLVYLDGEKAQSFKTKKSLYEFVRSQANGNAKKIEIDYGNRIIPTFDTYIIEDGKLIHKGELIQPNINKEEVERKRSETERNINKMMGYADGGMMAKGGKTKKDPPIVRGYFEDEAIDYAKGGSVDVNSLNVGDKIGFLRPRTGRYEYADILSIEGDNINLVVRHPKRSQWDNYFTETKERVKKFTNQESEDFKEKSVMKIKKFADGGTMTGWCYSIGGL